MTAAPANLAARPPAPAPQMTELQTFPGRKVGDPDVTSIVKLGPRGEVRSMLTHVQLSEEKGEVWRMWDKNYTGRESKMAPRITALGYDKLNQFAGVSFVAPRTVLGDDGQPKPNPYMHRDGNGDLLWVRVQRVGVGLDVTGSLVFHDLVLNYSLSTYFAQDLLTKWKGRKQKGGGPATPKAWGALRSADAQFTPPAGGAWKPYRVPGDLHLWVDLTHPEVIEMVGEHINRQKFAERNALTICERNILKKHFAAVKLDESLTVPVVGWVRLDRDLAELGDSAARAKEGHVMVDGVEATVERESVTAGAEDVDEAMAADADETSPQEQPDEPEPASVAPTAPKKENPQRLEFANARTKIRMYAERLGDKALEVIAGYNVDGLEEVAQLGNLVTLKAIQADLEKLDTPAARKGKGKQETLPLS